MENSRHAALGIALTVVLAAGSSIRAAEASIVEIDLLAPGDKLLTRVSDTGLDWVDVDAFEGLSYFDVAAGAGLFDAPSLGFRHATKDEVSALYTAFGIVTQDGAPHPENLAGAQDLLAMMGQTNPVGSFTDVQRGLSELDPLDAFVANFSGAGIYDGPALPDCLLPGDCAAANAFQGPISKASTFSNPTTFGHYLVRASAVPEPAALALAVLGFAGVRRSRKRAAPAGSA